MGGGGGMAPLKLNWSDFFPPSDDAPPPELEIIPAAQPSNDFSKLSDHLLNEKIQRLSNMSPVYLSKLPDSGAKLRASLAQLQEERDRRKRAKALRKDVGKNERPRQVKTAESSDSFDDFDPNCKTPTYQSQSSFASSFSQRLNGKISASFDGEWTSVNKTKCTNLKKDGQLHGRRDSTKMSSQSATTSSRVSPFQCPSNLAHKSKLSSSYSDDRRTKFPSIVGGGNFFSASSKRRRGLANRLELDSRSKKVPDVVLLDDEEVADEEMQLQQPMLGDTPDNWQEARIYYPSRDHPESIELSYSDIECLKPESYISSPIMNFYIQYLQRPLSPIRKSKGEYYFFNTYFYKKLEEAVSCKGDKIERFLKLRRWWKGVDIFAKAYIFLPIHGALHWSLVIICIPAKEDESGPIVLHLDSLGMHDSDTIFKVVYSYLEEEWKHINKNDHTRDLPISERIWVNLPRRFEKRQIVVPQQKNEYDCGLFVLYFMERFIDEAPERLKRKDLVMFGSKWFKPEEASSLRKRIQDLLVEEFENARLENGRSQESLTSCCSSPDNDID